MKIPDNAHSVIHNYGIAGMDSYLIGSLKDRTRLFHMTRNQVDYVTPHSHKYDLSCQVLSGCVVNSIFTKTVDDSDTFLRTNINYMGKAGVYEKSTYGAISNYIIEEKKYFFGQCYNMSADEIHSIWFSKDALVLIKEGEQVTDKSVILEPYSNNRHINNFHVNNGLFVKGESVSV